MKQPTELILLGAGQRGVRAYASYALTHPDRARFVAVAEPDPIRRARFAAAHGVPPDRCFASWEEALAAGQLAEAAVITTQDQMHVAPAVTAMQAGYHVLLEKPMADSLAGCLHLVQTAEQTNRLLQICHVLRYAPFFQALHRVLRSGRLGEIVTVEHRENVAAWHMAHSYVRGNWGNSSRSTPMILAKCCHDLDILYWNLGRPVTRLSSVGSLFHFRGGGAGAPNRREPSVPDRCTDGCPVEADCLFSAIGIYLDYRPFRADGHVLGIPLDMAAESPGIFPFTVLGPDTGRAGRRRALETGPYGRCVYGCDNDVVDHQVVAMEFQGGASGVLVMHGHAHREERTMRYDGTRATLRGRFTYGHPGELTLYDHVTGAAEPIPIPESSGGHGGGDWGLMADFLAAVRGRAKPLTTARESLESHLMAFAAEEARQEGTVVALDQYRIPMPRKANLSQTGSG